MSAKTCRSCGAPVTQPSTGRPRTYCSTGCRRLAEHDIRRANGAITALENALQYYRFDGRIKLRDDEQQAAFVASELIAARKKLRALLD